MFPLFLPPQGILDPLSVSKSKNKWEDIWPGNRQSYSSNCYFYFTHTHRIYISLQALPFWQRSLGHWTLVLLSSQPGLAFLSCVGSVLSCLLPQTAFPYSVEPIFTIPWDATDICLLVPEDFLPSPSPFLFYSLGTGQLLRLIPCSGYCALFLLFHPVILRPYLSLISPLDKMASRVLLFPRKLSESFPFLLVTNSNIY